MTMPLPDDLIALCVDINGEKYIELRAMMAWLFPGPEEQQPPDPEESYAFHIKNTPLQKLISLDEYKQICERKGSIANMHDLAVALGREHCCMCWPCVKAGKGGFFS